jgi:hypothetical protein
MVGLTNRRLIKYAMDEVDRRIEECYKTLDSSTLTPIQRSKLERKLTFYKTDYTTLLDAYLELE